MRKIPFPGVYFDRPAQDAIKMISIININVCRCLDRHQINCKFFPLSLFALQRKPDKEDIQSQVRALAKCLLRTHKSFLFLDDEREKVFCPT